MDSILAKFQVEPVVVEHFTTIIVGAPVIRV